MNFKEFINEDKLEQRYSAGLAIIWQGKVLLAHTTGRKSSTGWGIPKGGIDKGESKINAAISENTFVVTSRSKKYTKIVSYFLVKIDDLSQVGLKKPKISKSKLQLEEIDAAEFMSVDQAKNGIMFSQYPILNVLQSNGLA